MTAVLSDELMPPVYQQQHDLERLGSRHVAGVYMKYAGVACFIHLSAANIMSVGV